MVPHLYTRTYTLDDLVLMAKLLSIGHQVMSACGEVPASDLERSLELQIRTIGDDLPVDLEQPA